LAHKRRKRMRRRLQRRVAAEQHRSPTHSPNREISRKPEAIRIELLSSFRVWVGSRVIDDNQWRLRKAKSLVKLLALSVGHRLHREQVMEMLWPGLEPHAAANNLYYALHVARRTLEPSGLASSGADAAATGYLQLSDEQLTLCPDSALWVDVEAFEEGAAAARQAPLEPNAFRAAIDLYAGELLPEDRYETWVEERRAQLKELYLSLLLELGALLEEREEFGKATEVLGRVVTQEPTHEGAHAGLMRLYALLGRRREALRQYERLREALTREFGREPEAASRRLQQEIWTGTFPQHRYSSPPAGLPEDEEGAPSAEGETSRRHNLPVARTSFVGREREMLVVKRLLAMTKLLTLTGTGGCGKTRLALEVARDLVGAYPDGVWLVELAPLSDAALVKQAVAQAMGVREQPGRPLLETLKDILRPRKTLLVVDNCEHLVEEVARLVDALLTSCPHLRILATSRQKLNAIGEVNRVVPSLTVPVAMPDARQPYTPRKLEVYESVRLFVDRARQRDPSFVLTARNAQAITQVCRGLEGIPLAIELAAARMEVLSADQLSDRLEDSLKLLSRGERSAEPRHRSLRATLEWSHELLSDHERALFRRLAVFAGGWTLEAAEEVCSDEGIEEGEVLDLLSELVERSLVVAEAGEEVRFRMLEPIRQYGEERLQESGTAERLRERHARYYLALAEGEDTQEAELKVGKARPVAWLERMEVEHANLRAALSWLLYKDAKPDAGRAELGLRLAVALRWFWHTRSHQIEGRRYLESAASRRSSSSTTGARLRARALDGASWLAMFQGDIGAAKALIEEGLALYRQLGDEEGIASALTDLGLVAVLGQRDDIPLPAVMEELGELKPRLENRNTLAYLLMLEGIIAAGRGDVERSVLLHEQSLKLFREIPETQGIISCVGQLGGLALVRGDYEGALPLLRESLRLGWQSDYKAAIQFSFYCLASVAASRQQPVRAARLWGIVEGMEEAYGLHLAPMALSLIDYEVHLGIARLQLDEEIWLGTWAQGKAMALEGSVAYALSEEEEHEAPTLVAVPEQHPPVDERTERLTPREQEVALLASQGLTNRQIADTLSISEHTVANHVRKILKKWGLRSRAQISSS